MADKILDVRHVMDEMVSPEGLQAGGGGGTSIDDFVAGAGIEIMPDFLTESKIQISVDPSVIEVGDTFYANIDIPDDPMELDHSNLVLSTNRPEVSYSGTIAADEAAFYDDNGNTFTPSELRAYMMTHAMKSIQVTIRDYNLKKLVVEAKYNSNSGRMFNGTELGTGPDLVTDDQTITIGGSTYSAMPIYYASFTYDQTNQTVDWYLEGQLEAADSLIGSVIGTQAISTGETVTGAINTLIDNTILSTTEKAVGTDYNGDTIYEKTIVASQSTYTDANTRRTFNYENLLTGVKRIVDTKGSITLSSQSVDIMTQFGATFRNTEGKIQTSSFDVIRTDNSGVFNVYIQADNTWIIADGNEVVISTSIAITVQYTKL